MNTAKAGRTAALSAHTAQNRYLARSCPIKLAFTAQSQHNRKRRTVHIRRAEFVLSRKAVADLLGQVINGERENGVAKGRECALKYAAGVRTRGERRYAIFERTVNDMPVAYRLAMEENRRLSIPCFPFPF